MFCSGSSPQLRGRSRLEQLERTCAKVFFYVLLLLSASFPCRQTLHLPWFTTFVRRKSRKFLKEPRTDLFACTMLVTVDFFLNFPLKPVPLSFLINFILYNLFDWHCAVLDDHFRAHPSPCSPSVEQELPQKDHTCTYSCASIVFGGVADYGSV